MATPETRGGANNHPFGPLGEFMGKVFRRRRESERRLEEPMKTEVRVLNQQNLRPILEHAFGSIQWDSRDPNYWNRRWEFQPGPPERKANWSPEVKQTYRILRSVIAWTSDSETRGHLDPAPGIPIYDASGDKVGSRVPRNEQEVDHAVGELAKFHNNYGEPQKITTLVAFNTNKQPVGIGMLRWHGDPYVPVGSRRTSWEGLITDPRCRRRGVATRLTATGLEFAFTSGYNGKGAIEVRAWIMSDRKAGDWNINWEFFRKFKFQTVRSQPHWPEFALKRGIHTDRDAHWFYIRPEWFREYKAQNPLVDLSIAA